MWPKAPKKLCQRDILGRDKSNGFCYSSTKSDHTGEYTSEYAGGGHGRLHEGALWSTPETGARALGCADNSRGVGVPITWPGEEPIERERSGGTVSLACDMRQFISG